MKTEMVSYCLYCVCAKNYDGTLTAAGKKRYYNDDGSPTSEGLCTGQW